MSYPRHGRCNPARDGAKNREGYLETYRWAFTQALFWTLGVVLIAYDINKITVVLLMSLRLLIQGFIYHRVMKRLEEQDLIWLFPFYEIAQLFFQLIFVFSNLFNQKKRW